MPLAKRRQLLPLLLAATSLLAPFPTSAAETTIVDFPSASTPPSKFKIKQAKAKGIELKPKPGFPISGKLGLPDGDGPFPALVLLHDCQGPQAFQDDWAATFRASGYATLQVDSFSPRDVSGTCEDVLGEGVSGLGGERVMDAFGALFYLKQHPAVDPNRIGAVGWSRSSTTGSALRDGSRQFFAEGFRAVVSFYPNCKSVASAVFADPILILNAGKNDWTQPELCSSLAEVDANVEIAEFPDALQGFDDPKWGQETVMPDYQNTLKSPTFGVTFGFNATAHDKAEKAVLEFLKEKM
ncbi:dienelactone hydrolase family protein [Roseibium sediminicola]|uniref:Dienelactone hydrolase family protein n=1 Tax=Roseibium sediminicola TaxID=2933272 RepID=A0ABT0GUT3_9HYPH|nr:dienelactone hydrolase family protein [Roseibium sp. CAU 1639]MCK7612852.1 dienelactone hydrolase family protein [Roseibium sp. CAU 1639]